MSAGAVSPAAVRRAGHAGLLLAVAVFSFLLQQAPYAFSSRPDSLGADADSAQHFTFQMKLQDPSLFPKDVELNEMLFASRSSFEFALHSVVVRAADACFGGDLFRANRAFFWFFHLLFLIGCYALALETLKDRAAAALFAAASVGLSQAMGGWWGMAFGALVPKYVGMSFVPWFLLWYWRAPLRPGPLAALFFSIGLSANLYPLVSMQLGAALFLAAASMPETRRWSPLLLESLLAGAAPVLWATGARILGEGGRFSPAESEVLDHLLRQFYKPAFFNGSSASSFFMTPLWPLAAWTALGWALRRRALKAAGASFPPFRAKAWFDEIGAEGRRVFFFSAWTLALTSAGFLAGRVHGALVSLLFYRASAFLYAPLYLLCAWLAVDALRRRGMAPRLWGAAAAVLLVWNGARHTAAWGGRGEPPPPTVSAPYRALAEWAASSTPRDSLFLPFYGSDAGSFYAFRAYARRGVLLHPITGEVVVSNPRGALLFWVIARDLTRLVRGDGGAAEFADFSRRHAVDYIVFERGVARKLDLPVAYKNEAYIVYQVPPDPAGARGGTA